MENGFSIAMLDYQRVSFIQDFCVKKLKWRGLDEDEDDASVFGSCLSNGCQVSDHPLPMPTSCPGKWASLKGKDGFPQSPFFRGICQLFGAHLWAEVAFKKKC